MTSYTMISAVNPVTYISIPYRLLRLAPAAGYDAAVMMSASCLFGAAAYVLSLATPPILRRTSARALVLSAAAVLELGIFMMYWGNANDMMWTMLAGTGVANLGQNAIRIVLDSLTVRWALPNAAEDAGKAAAGMAGGQGRGLTGRPSAAHASSARIQGVRSLLTVSGDVLSIFILGSVFPIRTSRDNAFFGIIFVFVLIEMFVFAIVPNDFIQVKANGSGVESTSLPGIDGRKRPSTPNVPGFSNGDRTVHEANAASGVASGDEESLAARAIPLEEDVGTLDILFRTDYARYRRIVANSVAFAIGLSAFSANLLYFIMDTIDTGHAESGSSRGSDDSVACLSYLSIAINIGMLVSTEIGVQLTNRVGAMRATASIQDA